jgi:hypothetical protein
MLGGRGPTEPPGRAFSACGGNWDPTASLTALSSAGHTSRSLAGRLARAAPEADQMAVASDVTTPRCPLAAEWTWPYHPANPDKAEAAGTPGMLAPSHPMAAHGMPRSPDEPCFTSRGKPTTPSGPGGTRRRATVGRSWSASRMVPPTCQSGQSAIQSETWEQDAQPTRDGDPGSQGLVTSDPGGEGLAQLRDWGADGVPSSSRAAARAHSLRSARRGSRAHSRCPSPSIGITCPEPAQRRATRQPHRHWRQARPAGK